MEEELEIERTNQKAAFGEGEELEIERTNQRAAFGVSSLEGQIVIVSDWWMKERDLSRPMTQGRDRKSKRQTMREGQTYQEGDR